jgi:hypothetical protein
MLEEVPRSQRSSLNVGYHDFQQLTTYLYLVDDAAKLSNKVKGDLPGAQKEAKTGIELTGKEAGQQFDNAVSSFLNRPITEPKMLMDCSQVAKARDATSKIDSKLEGYRASAEQKIDSTRKEVGKDLTAAIDSFDKNVEKGAAKGKSWLSGWF